MRAQFTDVDGVRTRYHFEGSGYPLMLVHGGGVSGECWLRNIDALAEAWLAQSFFRRDPRKYDEAWIYELVAR